MSDTDPTPPAASAGDDFGVGGFQQQLSADQGIASQERQKLDQMIGSGPTPPNNPNPTFNEQQPQDHLNSIVGITPALMALGAIGGKFGNVHGIAMLQSTNAMMKGFVQGSADQYSDARQQYEQKFETWKSEQKTWFDTYKAYMEAYKGSIDAQQRAVSAANQAVSIDSKDLNFAQSRVSDMNKLGAVLEKNHQEFLHWGSQDVANRIRADASQQNADTNVTKADTAKTVMADKHDKAKKQNMDADRASVELVGKIDSMERELQNNKFLTGAGGKARKFYEFLDSSVTGDSNLPATKFASEMNLLLAKVPEIMKMKGKMGKDQRDQIEAAVSGIRNATSEQQAIIQFEALKGYINAPQTKTLGGKTYMKGQDGQWYGPPS